jgi:CRP/FNR family transcriptional regulator
VTVTSLSSLAFTSRKKINVILATDGRDSTSSTYQEACRDVKSQFLDGLTEPELKSVLAASEQRQYITNSVITNAGDPADYLFLLKKGRARYFSVTPAGQKVVLFWFSPGDVFGLYALVGEPSNYLLSSEMVEDGSVLAWRRSKILDILARYPKLQDNALSIAGDYLSWFQASHLALISHTARQRLARVLTSLAQGIGRQVSGGTELSITNEELANTANVSLFTASRILSEWQRNGEVSKKRGSIVLRTTEALTE